MNEVHADTEEYKEGVLRKEVGLRMVLKEPARFTF
jgi:hypothetical protein